MSKSLIDLILGVFEDNLVFNPHPSQPIQHRVSFLGLGLSVIEIEKGLKAMPVNHSTALQLHVFVRNYFFRCTLL